MHKRTVLAIAFVSLLGATGAVASAQDAAETAVILSGSSGQGKASRTLGSAIAGSIGSAADSVHGVRQSRPVTRHRKGRSGSRGTKVYPVVIASDIDVLEYSDAPTYELENGAKIRTSGAFYPSTAKVCERNCPN